MAERWLSYRWYRLMAPIGKQAGIRRVTAALAAGQLLNLIYPARAGDVSRILIIGKDGAEKAYVFGSVLLEKLVDLAAYILLAIILLVRLPFPGWLVQSVYLAAGATILGIGVLVWMVSSADRIERLGGWLAVHVRWLPEHSRQSLVELAQMTFSALRMVRQRKMAAELIGLTVGVWLTALLNNILVWYALDMNVEHASQILPATLMVLIGLMAGIAVPSVPGRIGVFEYICVVALAVFGIGQVQALTYGVTLHAMVFLPQLVMGAGALLWLSWKPASIASGVG